MNDTNTQIIRNSWQRLNSRINDFSLENDLRRKWTTLGNEISFAGVTQIYKYYKKSLSKEKIEEILSTIPTYSKFKEKRKSNRHNPIFVYYKHQMWGIDLMYVKNGNLGTMAFNFC